MCSGTLRIGETEPCRTRPSERLWQRLYLRPLPHQQGSLACGSRAGASATVRIRTSSVGGRDRDRRCYGASRTISQPPAVAGRPGGRGGGWSGPARTPRRSGRSRQPPQYGGRGTGPSPNRASISATQRVELVAGRDRLRLGRRPRPDLAAAWAGGEVVVALRRRRRARSCPAPAPGGADRASRTSPPPPDARRAGGS